MLQRTDDVIVSVNVPDAVTDISLLEINANWFKTGKSILCRGTVKKHQTKTETSCVVSCMNLNRVAGCIDLRKSGENKISCENQVQNDYHTLTTVDREINSFNVV